MDGKVKHFRESTNNRMKEIFKIHSESQTTNTTSYAPQEDGLAKALWHLLFEFLDKISLSLIKTNQTKKIEKSQRVRAALIETYSCK